MIVHNSKLKLIVNLHSVQITACEVSRQLIFNFDKEKLNQHIIWTVTHQKLGPETNYLHCEPIVMSHKMCLLQI